MRSEGASSHKRMHHALEVLNPLDGVLQNESRRNRPSGSSLQRLSVEPYVVRFWRSSPRLHYWLEVRVGTRSVGEAARRRELSSIVMLRHRHSPRQFVELNLAVARAASRALKPSRPKTPSCSGSRRMVRFVGRCQPWSFGTSSLRIGASGRSSWREPGQVSSWPPTSSRSTLAVQGRGVADLGLLKMPLGRELSRRPAGSRSAATTEPAATTEEVLTHVLLNVEQGSRCCYSACHSPSGACCVAPRAVPVRGP